MKKVIISGATGALGMALIRQLTQEGSQILVLSHEYSSRNNRLDQYPDITIIPCSLQQLASVQNPTGQNWDVFYHFAWAGTTGAARNDMYLQNSNVKYALDAVDAASRFGCHTFIGSGSQAEYGRFEGKLTPETPAFPDNGYGIGKLAAGMMTREYAHQKGLRHLWVRILSLYGPYDGSQSLVMSTISQLKQGISPQCTLGEQLWDYLFSQDAACAFSRMGDSRFDGKTYVLGSGKVRPLADYIEDMRKIVSADTPVKLGAIPYSPRQVMHLEADISELIEDFGWRPVTDFTDGIRQILPYI